MPLSILLWIPFLIDEWLAKAIEAQPGESVIDCVLFSGTFQLLPNLQGYPQTLLYDYIYVCMCVRDGSLRGIKLFCCERCSAALA